MDNKIIKFILSAAGLLFILSSCIGIGCEKDYSAHQVSQPQGLARKLSQTEIFLTKNENDKTSVHITSLDREVSSTITLCHEGDGAELSPDGKFLVFEYGEMVEGEDRSGFWIRDLSTGEERKVFVWPEESSKTFISSPSFSPDSEHIVFSISWLDREMVGLGTVQLDGSNLQVLDADGSLNRAPIYSPDGKSILVICGGRDKDSGQPGFQLCIMNSDGSKRKIITEDGDSHGSYHFTPDSKEIIYTESEFGGILGIINRPYYRINAMDKDGSNKMTILDWNKPLGILEISKDGGEIIFFEHDGYPTRIFIINRDGSKLRHLAYFDQFLDEWFPENE